MILERDGKYYKKVEREEEISEIEYLKLKIAELEERINTMPVTVYQGCPWPCPRDNAVPDLPIQPIYIYPYTWLSTATGPDEPPYKITCHF